MKRTRTHILATLISISLTLSACGTVTPNEPLKAPVKQPPVDQGPVTPPVTDPDQDQTLNLSTWFYLKAGHEENLEFGYLSFGQGRTVKVTGLPQGVTASLKGKTVTLRAAPSAPTGSAIIKVTYGTSGAAPLLSGSTTLVLSPSDVPDPELGIKIRPETITLDDQTPSVKVSLDYLSLAGGRTIKFENLPPDVSWTVDAAARTGTLTRQAGAWDGARELVVNYVDPAMGIISQGRWQLTVNAAVATYTPVVSDLKTWSEVERQVLAYINEVRTHKSIGGDDVTYNTCVMRFPDTSIPMQPVDAGQVAARKHAAYISLEGMDPSVGPDGVRGHFEYNKASAAYYAFDWTDRLTRAVKENPQSKAAGFKAVSENAGGVTQGSKALTTQEVAASVVLGWLNSPGHCPQVMDPRYRFVGVGHVYNPSAKAGGIHWQHSVVMNPFY